MVRYDLVGVASNAGVSAFTTTLTNASINAGLDITDAIVSTSTNIETVTYTITPKILGSNAGTCVGTPFDIVVTVFPTPDIATSGDEIVCSDDVTNIVLSNPNSVSGTTYSWTVVEAGGVTGASAGTGGVISQQLFNVTNTPGTAVYTITPSANGCSGTSTMVTVTVNPNPVWTVIDNGVTEICEGQTTDIDLDSPTQNAVITLTSVTPSTGGLGGWTTIGTTFNFNPPAGPINIADALTNSNTTAETVTYTFDIAANGCVDPISKTVVIIVNPGPIFSITNTLPTICSGDFTSIQLTSPTVGADIDLITVIPGLITGYTMPPVPPFATGSILSDQLFNTTTSIQTIEYVFEVSAAGCTNTTTQSAFVNVLPIPVWTVTDNAPTICEGLSTDIDLDATTDNVTVFISNIIISDPGVSGFSPIGTTFNFNPPIGTQKITDALTNSTNFPQTVQYIFNAVAVGCNDPVVKSVTV